MIFWLNRFSAIRLSGLFLVCVAIFLGQKFSFVRVWSQEIEPAITGTRIQMEKEEKVSVEILRNKQALITDPGKVLEAIVELGKVARLRVSSSDTMDVLAEYIDVHKDSLVQSSNETSKPPGIIFRPIPSEDLFPAVVTYQYIGKSAIPVVVRLIENSESGSVRSHNAIYLIKYNFREDWKKAADYLREAAASSNSEEGKQRLLEAAIELLRAEHHLATKRPTAQQSPPMEQVNDILSKDYQLAEQALEMAILAKNRNTIGLGLKSMFFNVKIKAAQTIAAIDERSLVPNLVEALQRNQGVISGGAETQMMQNDFNAAVVSALEHITKLKFRVSERLASEDLRGYRPFSSAEIHEVFDKTRDWCESNNCSSNSNEL